MGSSLPKPDGDYSRAESSELSGKALPDCSGVCDARRDYVSADEIR